MKTIIKRIKKGVKDYLNFDEFLFPSQELNTHDDYFTNEEYNKKQIQLHSSFDKARYLIRLKKGFHIFGFINSNKTILASNPFLYHKHNWIDAIYSPILEYRLVIFINTEEIWGLNDSVTLSIPTNNIEILCRISNIKLKNNERLEIAQTTNFKI